LSLFVNVFGTAGRPLPWILKKLESDFKLKNSKISENWKTHASLGETLGFGRAVSVKPSAKRAATGETALLRQAKVR
jgi:hypothetical protein